MQLLLRARRALELEPHLHLLLLLLRSRRLVQGRCEEAAAVAAGMPGGASTGHPTGLSRRHPPLAKGGRGAAEDPSSAAAMIAAAAADAVEWNEDPRSAQAAEAAEAAEAEAGRGLGAIDAGVDTRPPPCDLRTGLSGRWHASRAADGTDEQL